MAGALVLAAVLKHLHPREVNAPVAYHAAAVRPLPRHLAPFALLAALAFAAVACTGDDIPTTEPPRQGGGDPSAPAPPSRDPGATEFVPGEFSYEYLGVTATLSWKGEKATLEIENAGDSELGQPGLYAVTNDQREVDAELPGAGPIPPGGSAALDVVFPDVVTLDETGFVVLLFGDQNWGALAPVQAR